MKITIIEDDLELAEKIAKKLKRNSYIVAIYNSKKDFLKNFKDNSDLYIVDLNLWESCDEWFEIISWLRKEKNSKNPIIITSWYSDLEKKVYWLDLWADDYLAKPFLSDELIARIRALLRRNSDEKSSIIKYKDYSFDTKAQIFVKWIDKKIHFTKKEIMLIELFIRNKDKVISRNKLITSIWWDYDWSWVADNTINVTFFNLRKKLWSDFDLETIISEWYILREK